jgi:hypothetical protein
VSATQWAEFAGLGFAMAVMAWVIYRLTWTVVRLVGRDVQEDSTVTGSDPGREGD